MPEICFGEKPETKTEIIFKKLSHVTSADSWLHTKSQYLPKVKFWTEENIFAQNPAKRFTLANRRTLINVLSQHKAKLLCKHMKKKHVCITLLSYFWFGSQLIWLILIYWSLYSMKVCTFVSSPLSVCVYVSFIIIILMKSQRVGAHHQIKFIKIKHEKNQVYHYRIVMLKKSFLLIIKKRINHFWYVNNFSVKT